MLPMLLLAKADFSDAGASARTDVETSVKTKAPPINNSLFTAVVLLVGLRIIRQLQLA